jgi:hypothetical protein
LPNQSVGNQPTSYDLVNKLGDDRGGEVQIGRYVLHLRSVHGVIIYLGEILNRIRESQQQGEVPDYLPTVRVREVVQSDIKKTIDDESLLFDVDIDHPRSGVFVSVDYADHNYYILSGEGQSGRSTEVMAVLTLLLNSFRSAQDLPRTQTTIISP